MLQFLGGNPGINRLLRFLACNRRSTLTLPIFFPGLLTGSHWDGGAGVQIPEVVTQLSTDAKFITLLWYGSVSFILGIEPNKLSFISQVVENTMSTLDMFDIDTEGRIIPLPREKDGDDEEKRIRNLF